MSLFKAVARCLLGIFFYLLTVMLVEGIFVAIFDLDPLAFLSNRNLFNSAGISYSLLQILIFSFYIWRRQKKVPTYCYTEKVDVKEQLKLPFYVFMALLVSLLVTNAMNILSPYVDFIKQGLEDYQQLFGSANFDPFNILAIIFVVFLVPIAEELLFRVLIIGELKQAMKPLYACAVSALIFAVAHWNPLQSVYTFFAGFILGLCYLQYRNFLYNVVMHMFFNCLGSQVAMAAESNEYVAVVYVLLVILGGIIGTYFFIRTFQAFLKAEKAREKTAEDLSLIQEQ